MANLKARRVLLDYSPTRTSWVAGLEFVAGANVTLTVTEDPGVGYKLEIAASGGGVSDGDKGDITVSGGGATWTIDNGVVTLAKMANMSTDRLLGRDTAGSGVPEEISVGNGLEFDGAGGIRRQALTGDVTAAAGGNATTIASDAVTYAKMQNVSATDKVLGRSTAGSGDVEEIPCTSAGRDLIGGADAAAQRDTLRVVPGSPATNYSALVARGAAMIGIGVDYTTTGSIADGADATGFAARYGNSSSGATSGIAISSASGIRVLQTRWVYTLRCSWRTDSTFTNVRWWIGVADAAGISFNDDSPNSGATFRQIIGLRGSTVVPDTNWQLYTASATAGTATDTGVAIAADTDYEAVFLITATSVSVSISTSGGAFSTPTVYSGADVPATDTNMMFMANCIPQAAAAHYLFVRGMCAYPTP